MASYSWDIRVISERGEATVVNHSMRRATVFIFDDAIQAQHFVAWLRSNFDGIEAAAETTAGSGKLVEI